MAFKLKYKNLKGVVGELRAAVKAHGKQADTIEKHIEDMDNSPLTKKDCGCWQDAGYRRKPGTKPCAKGSCYKPGKK